MSEYLPTTPAQIVDSAVEAAEAGAAILHLRARESEDGRPTGDPARFREICPVIAGRANAIINITTPTFDEAEAAAHHRSSILMTRVDVPHAGLP